MLRDGGGTLPVNSHAHARVMCAGLIHGDMRLVTMTEALDSLCTCRVARVRHRPQP